MANVSFHTMQKVTNNKSEILVRFFISHYADIRVRTKIYVPLKYWDNKLQRIVTKRYFTEDSIEANEVQQKLDSLKSLILNRYMDTPDVRMIDKYWLEKIIREFHHISEELLTIDCLVPRYIEAHNLEKRTADQYKVIQRIIQRYNKEVNPLYVGRITPSDIGEFENHLRQYKSPTPKNPNRIVHRSQNTINTKMRRLRAICNYAVELGMAEDTPFSKYHVKIDVYGTPTWLTIEERDTIYNTHFDSAALESQKDIFVFQCLIGCRVSDLLALTTDNVTPDGFVNYIQHKMRKANPITIRVPLTQTAKDIIAKYAGQPNNKLLPFITQINYNKDIKKILLQAGITRSVLVQNPHTLENEPRRICDIAASHLARRTFMANMFKQTKSERITSAFTGHAEHSAAFSRYTDIDDDMKREIIEVLEKR